jgi:hypothetical protein
MPISSPLGRRQTVAALLTLTFVTGLVDAVSYLRLGHVFVANMTGNVVFLGFSADPRSGLSAAASVIAIAGFVLGAFAGGRAAHHLAARHPGSWLATAFTAGTHPSPRRPHLTLIRLTVRFRPLIRGLNRTVNGRPPKYAAVGAGGHHAAARHR